MFTPPVVTATVRINKGAHGQVAVPFRLCGVFFMLFLLWFKKNILIKISDSRGIFL